MKLRRGFVTNSSSTNDIFQALGTAGAAALLGTVMNTVKVDENSKIITYALMETTHQPEKPRPPQVRVNDSKYVVWYFAAIRVIDVQYTKVEETNEVVTEVLRDAYVDEYTDRIQYIFDRESVEDWLYFTIDGEGDENGVVSDLHEGYKTCGIYVGAPDNDKFHFERRNPPVKIEFTIEANIEGKVFRRNKEVEVLPETKIYTENAYVLNDKSVKTIIPLEFRNKAGYEYKAETEISPELEEYCQVDLKKDMQNSTDDKDVYELVIKPKGIPIGRQGEKKRSFEAIVDYTATPVKNHLETIWNYSDIKVVEEGLIYIGKLDQEKRVIIPSYITDQDEEVIKSGDYELAPTLFKLQLIVESQEDIEHITAEKVNMWETEIEFEDLKGDSSSGKHLSKTYKYKIEPEGSSGDFRFIPKYHLPEYDERYELILPAECKYKGESYKVEIPIVLQGEPFNYEDSWDEEYRQLRKFIKKYVPGELWYEILTKINENKDDISISDFRLLRHSIWIEARDYLQKEREYQENLATQLKWMEWGASWVQWAGDQAFSYVLIAYMGPFGSFADMVITPMKDLFVKVGANVLADYMWSDELQADYTIAKMVDDAFQTEMKIFDSLVGDMFSEALKEKCLNPKELGKFLALTFTINYMKNIMTGKKKDGSSFGMWDALIATCKDLSSAIFKGLVSNKIKEYLLSKKTVEGIEDFFEKYVSNQIIQLGGGWQNEVADVAERYLGDIAGITYAKVYDTATDTLGSNKIYYKDDDLLVDFTLDFGDLADITGYTKARFTFSLNDSKEAFTDYLFSGFFKEIPFPTIIMETTDKPKYIKPDK